MLMSGKDSDDLGMAEETPDSGGASSSRESQAKPARSLNSTDSDTSCPPCFDEGETFDGTKVRVMASPKAPSRQEALEHNCTHIPFRDWCPHCVRGKAKGNPHFAKRDREESEVPIVAMDYAFMGDKGIVEDGEVQTLEKEGEIKIMRQQIKSSHRNSSPKERN